MKCEGFRSGREPTRPKVGSDSAGKGVQAENTRASELNYDMGINLTGPARPTDMLQSRSALRIVDHGRSRGLQPLFLIKTAPKTRVWTQNV